jgi:hypothetical protein
MQFIGTVFEKDLETKFEKAPQNFCHRVEIDGLDQKHGAERIMKKV